ncbi:MAG: histidine phosphatase family protein [Streptosporangiaceae bacterium]
MPPVDRGLPDRAVIYLARHGQTPLNETDALRGHQEPPLDETGHKQARQLAAAIGAVGLTGVFASPSARARQTAQPIADQAGLNLAIDGRFRDRDYGQWTGQSRTSVTARWGSIDRAPGVESRAAVTDRALDGLIEIARAHRHGSAAVVSHDAVNRLLLVAFRPELGDPDAIPQGNGCFNVLLWCGDRFTVLNVNEEPRGLCGPEPPQA